MPNIFLQARIVLGWRELSPRELRVFSYPSPQLRAWHIISGLEGHRHLIWVHFGSHGSSLSYPLFPEPGVTKASFFFFL